MYTGFVYRRSGLSPFSGHWVVFREANLRKFPEAFKVNNATLVWMKVVLFWYFESSDVLFIHSNCEVCSGFHSWLCFLSRESTLSQFFAFCPSKHCACKFLWWQKINQMRMHLLNSVCKLHTARFPLHCGGKLLWSPDEPFLWVILGPTMSHSRKKCNKTTIHFMHYVETKWTKLWIC